MKRYSRFFCVTASTGIEFLVFSTSIKAASGWRGRYSVQTEESREKRREAESVQTEESREKGKEAESVQTEESREKVKEAARRMFNTNREKKREIERGGRIRSEKGKALWPFKEAVLLVD